MRIHPQIANAKIMILIYKNIFKGITIKHLLLSVYNKYPDYCKNNPLG